MRAAVLNDVLTEVAGGGVCHTDLHVVKDEVAFPMPCVLGHEISGTVLAVGGVGTNLIQMAKVYGASRIIAVDLVAEKLDLARELGATDVIDASDGDAAEGIRELTNGRGADVAFEALGHPATVDAAIRSVDEGGRAVLVGIAPKGVTASFDITHVVRRKIRVLGSYGARARTDMPMVLQLAAEGRIDLERLITRRVPLADASDTYDALARGEIVGRAVVDLASSG